MAIGGMLVSAFYTLYKMRKSLFAGVGRSVGDVKKAMAGQSVDTPRVEKDLSFIWIVVGILACCYTTFIITFFIFKTTLLVAIVAATILIILAFFFAAVSGYLVGIMGSSNNPISGLTLTALVVTAINYGCIGCAWKRRSGCSFGSCSYCLRFGCCCRRNASGFKSRAYSWWNALENANWRYFGCYPFSLVMFGVLVF